MQDREKGKSVKEGHKRKQFIARTKDQRDNGGKTTCASRGEKVPLNQNTRAGSCKGRETEMETRTTNLLRENGTSFPGSGKKRDMSIKNRKSDRRKGEREKIRRGYDPGAKREAEAKPKGPNEKKLKRFGGSAEKGEKTKTSHYLGGGKTHGDG